MAIQKIDEIFIYANPDADQLETYTLYRDLDNAGVQYNKLEYNDPEQHKVVLDAVNSWWQPNDEGVTQPPVSTFPFAVYTEIHNDKPISYLPRKYICGRDAIVSQLTDLYKLGR